MQILEGNILIYVVVTSCISIWLFTLATYGKTDKKYIAVAVGIGLLFPLFISFWKIFLWIIGWTLVVAITAYLGSKL